MTDQEREAFRRMVEEMPADERAAMLAAFEGAEIVDGQVDLMAVTRDALARLKLTPPETERAIRAALADPPDWRTSLT